MKYDSVDLAALRQKFAIKETPVDLTTMQVIKFVVSDSVKKAVRAQMKEVLGKAVEILKQD